MVSETAIAAGIRRIEAISGSKFQEYLLKQQEQLEQIKALLKNPQDVLKSLESLVNEKTILQKKIEQFNKEKLEIIKKELVGKVISKSGIHSLCEKIEVASANDLKDLSYQLKSHFDNLFLVLAAEIDGKASLSVMISDNLVKDKNLNAGNIIREIAKEVDGSGGGQAFFASASGKKPNGIPAAINKVKGIIEAI